LLLKCLPTVGGFSYPPIAEYAYSVCAMAYILRLGMNATQHAAGVEEIFAG
jgi:hypothetical protein